MTTLKELTHSNHELAEAHPFTKLLLTGNIPENVYADFLYNQQAIYYSLEAVAKRKGLLNGLDGLERSEQIGNDFDNLPKSKTTLYPSTLKYINYITNRNLSDNQILAHLYVRHMGDLYGGKVIAKRVPGSGKMYRFDDRPGLIKALDAKLTLDIVDEALFGFDLAAGIFDDLWEKINE